MKLKVVIVDLEIPSRVKKWGLRIGIPAIALIVAAVALAQPAGLVTFSDGQTLTAAELNTNFSYLQNAMVPSGAVMAFNLGTCPTGWSAYAAAGGRTIIGVNEAGGNTLSQRNLGDTLGEETHTQTVDEMPSHGHAVTDPGHSHAIGPQTGNNVSGDLAYFETASGPACGLDCSGPGQFPIAILPTVTAAANTDVTVQATGGSTPFNNMQPSIALLYCQKN